MAEDVLQHVGYLLKRVQQALRARMDEALRAHGLSTSQYAVLAVLEQLPDVSNAELARRSFVTPQTMIRIVTDLERSGLLERRADPGHARVLQARLTERGRQAVRTAHSAVFDVEDVMLGPLGADEQAQLRLWLGEMAGALEGPG